MWTTWILHNEIQPFYEISLSCNSSNSQWILLGLKKTNKLKVQDIRAKKKYSLQFSVCELNQDNVLNFIIFCKVLPLEKDQVKHIALYAHTCYHCNNAKQALYENKEAMYHIVHPLDASKTSRPRGVTAKIAFHSEY